MKKKYEIAKEDYEKIKAARKSNKNKNVEKRLYALELSVKGLNNREISEKTGYNRVYVGHLIARYLKEGLDAICNIKRVANRRNMSIEEEIELLNEFKEKASKGQVIRAKDIRKAYEEKIGRPCGNGQIYRVLKRHNARKVKPRGQHPKKASQEVIEASKKLTLA